jgi:receptor protein-tyrosine kinase
MSRIFAALQQSIPEMAPIGADPTETLPALLAKPSGDLSSLGEVPSFSIPTASEKRLFAFNDPNCLGAEKIRAVAARLRYAQQRRALKKVLVASAVRGDGKTMMSSNLALTLASHGEKTLLIDGDLHKPSLSSLLGVNHQERGFANWWAERDDIVSYLHKADRMPLWFFPAGTCHEQPLTVIQSAQTAELVKQLGEWFSWVIIDSPPLVPLADAGIWATISDAVLLLLRQAKTPKKELRKGLESLDKSKIFGIVLNDATTTEEKYYREYYRDSTRQAKAAAK